MTPAEELRAAAKLMRECAEAADAADWPGGPWAVDKCSENGCPCIVYQGERNPYTEPQVPRIQYVADTETPEHAAYIASMHPGVALAVADWLGTHRAVAYGRYVFISYFDKRYPMDVAGWAFEHGHAADDAASAVIAGL